MQELCVSTTVSTDDFSWPILKTKTLNLEKLGTIVHLFRDLYILRQSCRHILTLIVTLVSSVLYFRQSLGERQDSSQANILVLLEGHLEGCG